MKNSKNEKIEIRTKLLNITCSEPSVISVIIIALVLTSIVAIVFLGMKT